MKKTLQISNVIALIVTIVVNYLSTAGIFNSTTIADLSAKYHTLFTPASYAFAIWGLIYLMLAGFVMYECLASRTDSAEHNFLLQTGWWFAISCLANCLWIVTWIYEWTGISVLMMIVLLGSLLKIVMNTNMERWDAPLKTIFFEWWPFCFYAGWITVALIANIAAWLTKIGWGGFGLNNAGWAVIMVIVAGLINLAMIWRRNMREFAVVGIWALIAVAVANGGSHEAIVWTSGIVSAMLFAAICVHGYQNRETAPMKKWKG